MATPRKKTPAKQSQYQLTQYKITQLPANLNEKKIDGWRISHRSAARIINPVRTLLYDYYNDILLDGHLSGIIKKRNDAVLNKRLSFKNAAGEEVKEMHRLIGSRQFRHFQEVILEAIQWGMSLFEFIPGTSFNFELVPRKHVKPNLGIISFDQNGMEGITYKDLWNFFFVGKENDLGLLLKCCPYAIYKRGGIADWMQFVEQYGIPMRVIYYSAHDDRTSLLIDEELSSAGSGAILKLPEESRFQIIDGKQVNGDGALQNTARMAMNEEMSVIQLGVTETTTSSKSSGHAQAKEHGKQQMEGTKSDMVYMLNWLNDPHFLNILKTYGYPVEGGEFYFEREYDTAVVKEQMEIILAVEATGNPVNPDDIYELTGLSQPKNFEAAKQELIARKSSAAQQSPAQPLGKQNGNPENKGGWDKLWSFFVEAPWMRGS